MEIVIIFAEVLYAFRYEGEEINELHRLMDQWMDVEYLYRFAKENQVQNKRKFVEEVLRDAETIDDVLEQIGKHQLHAGSFFEPLERAEQQRKILALYKGKYHRNRLRLYAIRLEDSCFVITGGAIKMSQKMADHPGTALELEKLKNARRYLEGQDITDGESFFELIN